MFSKDKHSRNVMLDFNVSVNASLKEGKIKALETTGTEIFLVMCHLRQ